MTYPHRHWPFETWFAYGPATSHMLNRYPCSSETQETIALQVEQAKVAHLCTLMSNMHHRRAGYPFGTLVDFASDSSGFPIFCLSPLAIHTRNILEDSRCSLVSALCHELSDALVEWDVSWTQRMRRAH